MGVSRGSVALEDGFASTLNHRRKRIDIQSTMKHSAIANKEKKPSPVRNILFFDLVQTY